MNSLFANGNADIQTIIYQHELKSIDEVFSSVELGKFSSTDNELTNAIFQVQSTLLDHRPMYLQISKNEFAALLLKALGPDKLTSSVVDDLFAEIDIDNDGLLSIEELAKYMIKVEQRDRKDQYRFFYHRLVRAPLLGPLAIIFANSLAIAKNCFIRFNGENHDVLQTIAAVAARLGCWLALTASILFIWGALHSIYQQLRDTHYRNFSARVQMFLTKIMTIAQVSICFPCSLHMWLYSCSPRVFTQVINILRMLGSIAFVEGHLLTGGLCYFAGGVLSVSITILCHLQYKDSSNNILIHRSVSSTVQIHLGRD